MTLHRIIAALFSTFRHQHKFRRARKGEDQGRKFCACGESREVKRRKVNKEN